MRKKLILVSFTLALCVSIAADKKSEACSCLTITLPKAFEQADAVFTGIPVLVKLQEKMLADVDGRKIVDGRIEFKFRVTKAWKGVTTGYVWVSTDAQPAACGTTFYPARSYLIFARGKHTLETTLCDRNSLETDAQRDLQELGPPRKYFNQQPEEEEP